MSQEVVLIDPTIPTGDTGATLAGKINDLIAALLSAHSASIRPSYAAAGTIWFDTTTSPWILKCFDGTEDGTILTFNPSTHEIALDVDDAVASAVAATVPALIDEAIAAALAGSIQAAIDASIASGAQPRTKRTNVEYDASRTLDTTDLGKLVRMNVGTACNVTINNTIFSAGDTLEVEQTGAGQVSFVAGSGVTIRSYLSLAKLAGQYAGATLWWESASVVHIVGNLSA